MYERVTPRPRHARGFCESFKRERFFTILLFRKENKVAGRNCLVAQVIITGHYQVFLMIKVRTISLYRFADGSCQGLIPCETSAASSFAAAVVRVTASVGHQRPKREYHWIILLKRLFEECLNYACPVAHTTKPSCDNIAQLSTGWFPQRKEIHQVLHVRVSTRPGEYRMRDPKTGLAHVARGPLHH